MKQDNLTSNVDNKENGDNNMQNKLKLLMHLAGIRKSSQFKELTLKLLMISDDYLVIEGLTADKIAKRMNIKETQFLTFSSKLGKSGLIEKSKTGKITNYDLAPMLDKLITGE